MSFLSICGAFKLVAQHDFVLLLPGGMVLSGYMVEICRLATGVPQGSVFGPWSSVLFCSIRALTVRPYSQMFYCFLLSLLTY